MLVMLVIATGAGVYVWYVYQRVAQEKELAAPAVDMVTNETDTVSSSTRDTTVSTTSRSRTTEPPIVISADSLSSEQRAILETFGMGGARIEITDAVLECAQGALGEERLNEIVKGSAPSPLEALRLAGCLKK